MNNENSLIENLFNKIRKGSLIYYSSSQFYMICLEKKLTGNMMMIKGYLFNKYKKCDYREILFNERFDAKRTKVLT